VRWLIDLLRPRPPAGTVRLETRLGPIHAFENDRITRHLIEFGAHSRPELAMLLDFVDPGDRVFDLGAHIGAFALPLARKAGPGGTVLAVEADATHFGVLRSNIALQRLRTITPVRLLIGPDDTALTVGEREGNTGARHFVPAGEGAPAVDTPRATLDDLADRHGLPRVIKMDIEGFEHFALSHGADTVLAAGPLLYVEICEAQLNRATGATTQGIGDLLTARGYRLFRNVGPGNADHDDYDLRPLERLVDGGEFFNVLAIHRDDPRLSRI
jgi:FkbM family methyltransferase